MTNRPFIVFALPRSRTTWAAKFLSPGRICGHDLGIEMDTLAQFAEALRGKYRGTVETGAVIAWRALRMMLPEAKVAVIRRPVEQVYGSLEHLGFGSRGLHTMLAERSAMLHDLSRQKNVLTVDFSELTKFETCRQLYEHCLDEPLDWEWWEQTDKVIDTDVHAAIHRLVERRPAIERLKAEAKALEETTLCINRATWDEIWPEVNGLFADHFEEVDGGVEPKRPYRIDEDLMRAMDEAGQILIFSARIGGKLVGYCTWNIGPDVESKGLTIAQQGAWYARKGYEKERIGTKLFHESVEELKRLGVQCIFPHHRTQGRGARLGSFFRRLGAKEIQHTYSLWIGG